MNIPRHLCRLHTLSRVFWTNKLACFGQIWINSDLTTSAINGAAYENTEGEVLAVGDFLLLFQPN